MPFSDILTDDFIRQAMNAVDGVWKDRIYTPLVTLWVFLTQVLSADHSCRGAVARFIAHRLSQGQSRCSAETGAYCQARKRLPEKFFAAVTCLVGRALDAKIDTKWLWKGRRVYLFDGTTVIMPDNGPSSTLALGVRTVMAVARRRSSLRPRGSTGSGSSSGPANAWT